MEAFGIEICVIKMSSYFAGVRPLNQNLTKFPDMVMHSRLERGTSNLVQENWWAISVSRAQLNGTHVSNASPKTEQPTRTKIVF